MSAFIFVVLVIVLRYLDAALNDGADCFGEIRVQHVVVALLGSDMGLNDLIIIVKAALVLDIVVLIYFEVRVLFINEFVEIKRVLVSAIHRLQFVKISHRADLYRRCLHCLQVIFVYFLVIESAVIAASWRLYVYSVGLRTKKYKNRISDTEN